MRFNLEKSTEFFLRESKNRGKFNELERSKFKREWETSSRTITPLLMVCP
jgi:hypothetical protein